MNHSCTLAAVLGLSVLLPAGATLANDYVTVSDLDVAESPPASLTQGAEIGTVPVAPAGCTNDNSCGDNCCVESCRCGPRWTVTADAILMDRLGAPNVTLIRGSRQQELLNAKDFDFPFAAGPRLSLIRHGDCRDLEFVYFMTDGWSAVQSCADEGGATFLAPQYQVIAVNLPMSFAWTSKLYNAEVNLRVPANECVTLLAGFRWVGVREELVGSTTPFGPFWSTKTHNNLYGFQIGADARLWDRGGPFYITGLAKAGVYGNQAEQISEIPIPELRMSGSAVTNRTAFVGECGLTGVYQLTDHVALRAGYQVMWLEGIASPPDQIALSNLPSQLVSVNAGRGLFYHGALAGLEVAF